MSHPREQTDRDLDEDLFDFAGVVRESDAVDTEEDLDEIFASFRDTAPADELLAVPVASASSTPAPAPAPLAEPRPLPPAPPALAPAPRTEPAARTRSEVRPEPEPLRQEPGRPEPVREVVPAPRTARFSKGLVAIALSVTVLNSLLAVVVLRGNARAPAEHPAPAPSVEPRPDEAHAAPARWPAAELPDPDALDVAHAHPTLDEARAEIARGEYASARQRVYALLAIIDRLEDPRRGALEADCQFLIAQSLHLEALARMGESR